MAWWVLLASDCTPVRKLTNRSHQYCKMFLFWLEEHWVCCQSIKSDLFGHNFPFSHSSTSALLFCKTSDNWKHIVSQLSTTMTLVCKTLSHKKDCPNWWSCSDILQDVRPQEVAVTRLVLVFCKMPTSGNSCHMTCSGVLQDANLRKQLTYDLFWCSAKCQPQETAVTWLVLVFCKMPDHSKWLSHHLLWCSARCQPQETAVIWLVLVFCEMPTSGNSCHTTCSGVLQDANLRKQLSHNLFWCSERCHTSGNSCHMTCSGVLQDARPKQTAVPWLPIGSLVPVFCKTLNHRNELSCDCFEWWPFQHSARH